MRPSPAAVLHEARAPALLLLGALLLAGGGILLNRAVADLLLRRDAEMVARHWAEDLQVRLPELPALLERRLPAAEVSALLDQARGAGAVLRVRLLDRAGGLVFASDDADGRASAAPRPAGGDPCGGGARARAAARPCRRGPGADPRRRRGGDRGRGQGSRMRSMG